MTEKQILPILPLYSTVVFPQTVTSLHIGLVRNIKLMEDLPPHAKLVLAPALASRVLEAGPETVSSIGVLAEVTEVSPQGTGYLQASVEGRSEEHTSELQSPTNLV